MKKILLVTAFSVGSLTAFAQTTANAEMSANGAEVSSSVQQQDTFKAIKTSELPAAVTEALQADFPEAEVQAAYVNEAQQYKLEIVQADGTVGRLYADAEGNWISM